MKSFSFIWGVVGGSRVAAGVWLDGKRALVLTALTGDNSTKGKRGIELPLGIYSHGKTQEGGSY
ncbi:hypothetical protein [Pyrobaculum aerophilum]|uniref:hypothetical protein n=1 Tax=Pyrobaculum aerophilum TaxID=13773 RepID=UPI00216274B8|nr:hypothetical protein [Pyrobaculum aerophilum]